MNAIVRPPRLAGRGVHESVMVCRSDVGFGVEGVTEASLTSDAFVTCLFQHSCRRLAGLSPSASCEGVRKLREPQP